MNDAKFTEYLDSIAKMGAAGIRYQRYQCGHCNTGNCVKAPASENRLPECPYCGGKNP